MVVSIALIGVILALLGCMYRMEQANRQERRDSGGATASATVLTLPASMGATKTGWIVVEGY